MANNDTSHCKLSYSYTSYSHIPKWWWKVLQYEVILALTCRSDIIARIMQDCRNLRRLKLEAWSPASPLFTKDLYLLVATIYVMIYRDYRRRLLIALGFVLVDTNLSLIDSFSPDIKWVLHVFLKFNNIGQWPQDRPNTLHTMHTQEHADWQFQDFIQ